MTENERQRIDWLARTDRHYRDVEANLRWRARQARDEARRAAKET